MPNKKQVHITNLKQLEEISFAGHVLAELRGISSRAIERGADSSDENFIGIRKIKNEKGKELKGKYEARGSLVAMFKDLQRQLEEAKSSTTSARERNYELDARRKELDLAEREKDLVRVDEIKNIIIELLTFIKTKSSSTRKGIAPDLLRARDDKSINKKLEKRDNKNIHEYATFITNQLGSLAESADQNNSVSRSAKTARRRKTK